MIDEHPRLRIREELTEQRDPRASITPGVAGAFRHDDQLLRQPHQLIPVRRGVKPHEHLIPLRTECRLIFLRLPLQCRILQHMRHRLELARLRVTLLHRHPVVLVGMQVVFDVTDGALDDSSLPAALHTFDIRVEYDPPLRCVPKATW